MLARSSTAEIDGHEGESAEEKRAREAHNAYMRFYRSIRQLAATGIASYIAVCFELLSGAPTSKHVPPCVCFFSHIVALSQGSEDLPHEIVDRAFKRDPATGKLKSKGKLAMREMFET